MLSLLVENPQILTALVAILVVGVMVFLASVIVLVATFGYGLYFCFEILQSNSRVRLKAND